MASFKADRDLIVVSSKKIETNHEFERTVINLHNILSKVDDFSCVCKVSEIINLNNYKIYTSQSKVAFYINKLNAKPFVFIFNKN